MQTPTQVSDHIHMKDAQFAETNEKSKFVISSYGRFIPQNSYKIDQF